MAHGSFVWNELATSDVEAAKKFFSDTIGWSFDGMPMQFGTYWVAKANGQSVAGIMDKSVIPFEVPSHWFAYVEVDDVDARIASVEAQGGKVIRPPFDVEGVGRIAVVSDPTGAGLGWMTPVAAEA